MKKNLIVYIVEVEILFVMSTARAHCDDSSENFLWGNDIFCLWLHNLSIGPKSLVAGQRRHPIEGIVDRLHYTIIEDSRQRPHAIRGRGLSARSHKKGHIGRNVGGYPERLNITDFFPRQKKSVN